MPHEVMNVEQVSRYLKLSAQEVVKLASRGQIPARRVGESFEFRKGQVDEWVETRIHELGDERLAEIEHGVSAHHEMDHESALVGPLIPPGGVVVPLMAKTRDAAIRALVAAADAAELVYDATDLVEKVRDREELCSTAIYPGVALPHPRNPLPYDIAGSFVIVGRTTSGIPYGSPDGGLTRLFFLICCKDERTHLHVLARISRMLNSRTIEALMEADAAESLRDVLVERELGILAD
jgi:PTS system nitrogen regulatory IIA component